MTNLLSTVIRTYLFTSIRSPTVRRSTFIPYTHIIYTGMSVQLLDFALFRKLNPYFMPDDVRVPWTRTLPQSSFRFHFAGAHRKRGAEPYPAPLMIVVTLYHQNLAT